MTVAINGRYGRHVVQVGSPRRIGLEAIAVALHGIVSARTVDEVDRLLGAAEMALEAGADEAVVSVPGERATVRVTA